MLAINQYNRDVRRPYPPLFTSLFFEGYADYKNFTAFFKEPYANRNVVKSDENWYYVKKERELCSKLTFEYWQHKDKFLLAKKILIARENNLLKSTKADLPTFCRAYCHYMPAILIIYRVEDRLEKHVYKLLSKKISSQQTKKLLHQLNTPLQDNFYKQEAYDLVTTKNLVSHVKKYQWINSRYGERNPYTIEQAKARLSEINKEEFLKNYHLEKSNLRQTISYAKKILGFEDCHFIDFMQFILYYRTQRTDIVNKSMYLFLPKLKKLAKEKNLTYKQLIYCTSDEILSDKIPPIKIINERIRDHAMVMEDGVIRCVIGRESQKIKEKFQDKIGNIKQFAGMIASSGIAKGPAKIIFDRRDFSKIKSGDILVTSMTTPDMIAIMKKAAAFVTDEGGITCHAAIVAREMQKPCIIGTKIATRVLRDGDYVEANANNGIIKIVNNYRRREKWKGKVLKMMPLTRMNSLK